LGEVSILVNQLVLARRLLISCAAGGFVQLNFILFYGVFEGDGGVFVALNPQALVC